MTLARFSTPIVRTAGAGIVGAAMLLSIHAGARPAAADSPPPPQVLSATALNDTTIRVTWRDTSTTEEHFRVIHTPQGDTSGGRNDVWSEYLPSLPGSGMSGSYDVRGLRTGTTYCFKVLSYAPSGGAGAIVGQYSADSNRVCALAKAPPPPPAPGTGPVGSARTESDVARLHRPDLEVNLLDGPPQLFDGQTAVYTVGIWNNGDRPDGAVELQISFTGALEGLEMEQAPAGFTCTSFRPGARQITCTGTLGGRADAPVSRGMAVKVRVHATARGLGSVSAYVDPNGHVAESNEANNGRTLPVTVK